MTRLWDEYLAAPRLKTETVIINTFGETAQKVVLDENIHDRYAAYLARRLEQKQRMQHEKPQTVD